MTLPNFLASEASVFLDSRLAHFRILIPTRDYQTVFGSRLEKNGVTPDIYIPFSIEDFRSGRDATLEEALRRLD